MAQRGYHDHSAGAGIMTADQPPDSDGDELIVFRLYIASGAPNSMRAQTTLRRLCENHLRGHYRIEIVDVLEEPRRALNDNVLVTPALVKVAPLPSWQMTGDLSASSKILLALGIDEDSER